MEQKRPEAESNRIDLSSPLFFGKNPLKLGINFSDKDLVNKVRYGPVIGKQAFDAHTLERNLQKHAGAGDFPVHLDAYRRFINSFNEKAPRLFFSSRQAYFEDVHNKAASGEIRRSVIPELLTNVSTRHVRRFDRLCTAVRNNDAEGKRKARESLFNIDYL